MSTNRNFLFHAVATIALIAAACLFPPGMARAGEDLRRFHALCVGLSYPATAHKLNFTTRDAAMVAGAFEAASGFDREASRIALLVDDDPRTGDKPTPKEIRRRLLAIAREAKEGDRIVFYFSGHGDKDDNGNSILVCHGGKGIADAAGHLRLSDVRDILASSAAETKFVIIDACHSGGKAAGEDGLTSLDLIQGAFSREADSKAAGDKTLAWLSSSNVNEKSFEYSEKKQGLFTHFLLEALGDQAASADTSKDSLLSVAEIHTYVTLAIGNFIFEEKRKKVSPWHGRLQTPQAGIGGGIVLNPMTSDLQWIDLFYVNPDASPASPEPPDPSPRQALAFRPSPDSPVGQWQEFADAMTEGDAALAAENWSRAGASYRRAERIRGDDPSVMAGLEKARLGAVREAYRLAMAEGRAGLASEDWRAAESAFRRALGVDGRADDVEALAGLATARGGAPLKAYRQALADGDAALAAGDWLKAERAYSAALAAEGFADDAMAAEGLRQSRSGAAAQAYGAAMDRGDAALAAEDWLAAEEAYADALAAPGYGSDARARAGRSGARGEMARSAYSLAVSLGDERLAATDWKGAEAAYAAALKAPGFAGDRRAAKGLEDARSGAREETARSAYSLAVTLGDERLAAADWKGAEAAYAAALKAPGFAGDRRAAKGLDDARSGPSRTAYGLAVALGDEQLRQGNWRAAEAAYAAALKAPGYENDPRAREGLVAAEGGAELRLYRLAMSLGDEKLEREAWREAEAAYVAALRAPGYESDPDALEGLAAARGGPSRKARRMGEERYGKGEYAEALELFSKGAELGDVEAQNHLGNLYFNGQGVRRDYARALEWYQKAAEQDLADAQANIGYMYDFKVGVAEDFAKAFAWYSRAYRRKHPAAAYLLAWLYQNGQGVAKDEDRAAELFAEARTLGAAAYLQAAAELGSLAGQSLLGGMYADGTVVARDVRQAVAWRRKAAERGFAPAQYDLGECYYSGAGVAQDRRQAVAWFRKAADQDSAAAQVRLGECYFNGAGVSRDRRQAVDWYRKAADQGSAAAQVRLGLCYANGTGVSRDHEQAAAWHRKAAERGLAEAQHLLGLCYYTGEGVSQDRGQAVAWFRKAAEQGLARAQSDLGFCYANGEGVSRDHEQAVAWLRKAAEQGTAEAQYSLGRGYYNGEGVPRDREQAFAWTRKAAEQGHALAQRHLAKHYFEGDGVAKNFREAVVWYRKAAEQGNAESQRLLGFRYRDGEGVAKDEWQAADWFRRAADQGDAGAQYELGECYYYGRGVSLDYGQAVVWYHKAAEQGLAQAQFELGFCYSSGKGVSRDYAQSVAWYRKAVDQGHAAATMNLGSLYFNGNGVAHDCHEALRLFRLAESRGERGQTLYNNIRIVENHIAEANAHY